MSRSIRLGRNALDSLLANGFGLIVSVLSVVLLPTFATLETFGYWQLYLLYSSFVYVGSLGLNDGVYLRYGGRSFSDLDRPVLAGQFRALVATSITFGLLGFALAHILGNPSPVWLGVALLVPTLNLRSMLLYILQATNRFRPYAICLVIDRGFFSVSLLAILLAGPRLSWLVAADVVGKLLSLIAAVLICWRVVWCRSAGYRDVRSEIRLNIAAGSRLMMAGLAGMSIVGVIRIVIERGWGVEMFGRISLLLSAAHLLMSFVTALSQVVFPWLRTISSSRLPSVYKTVRTAVSLCGFCSLLAYWPIYRFIESMLPEYASALPFLALQIPLIVFESKISLLVNVYSNTLRKENALMLTNLAALLLSVLLAVSIGYFARNLFWTVSSMLFVQAFRSVVGELILARSLDLGIGRLLGLEISLVMAFIASMIVWGPMVGSGVYALCLGVYFVDQRFAIHELMRLLYTKARRPRVSV